LRSMYVANCNSFAFAVPSFRKIGGALLVATQWLPGCRRLPALPSHIEIGYHTHRRNSSLSRQRVAGG
jgi:hypothetical protein